MGSTLSLLQPLNSFSVCKATADDTQQMAVFWKAPAPETSHPASGPPEVTQPRCSLHTADCCCFTMTLRVSPEMISEWFSLAGLGPSLLGRSQLHLLRPSSPLANLFRAEADSHLSPDLAQCLDISQKIFNMLPPQVSNCPVHHHWRQKPSHPVPVFQISSNIL